MSSFGRIIGDMLAAGVEGAAEVAGSRIQRKLFEVGVVASLLLVALMFLIGAVAIALGGTYLLLAPQVGPASAAFSCAALALFIGLMLIIWAKLRTAGR
ncbi:MAG: hypothetical protein ACOCSQ_01750 [Planctomycetota bacterium]